MTKHEFLTALQKKLSGLSEKEANERIQFYSEMIDDRMEEGLSEADAVAQIGCIEETDLQGTYDCGHGSTDRIKDKKTHKTSALTVVLLILGSPIWLSLLISAFAVIISLYAVIWALDASLWAIFGALAGCFIGGMIHGAVMLTSTSMGLAVIGAAILCAGLAIFTFLGSVYATYGCAKLCRVTVLAISRLFKREG